MNTGPPARLDSLTGLRALAAMTVFAYHLAVVRPDRPELRLAHTGFVGVGLFYVLSGVVLAFGWRPERGRRRFYWLRLARVYPLYLLVVLGALALDAVQGELPGLPAILATLTLTQSWFPDPSIYFAVRPVFWSLSVEAFFYAVFPWLIRPLAGLRASARAAVAGGAVLVTVTVAVLGRDYTGGWVWFVYICPLTRLPEFVVGMVLGLALRRGWRYPARRWTAWALVGLAYATAGWVPVAARQSLWLLLPFAALVAAVGSADLRGRPSWLRSRPLLALGAWSYAVYLSHTIAIGGFDAVLGSPSRPGDLVLVVATWFAAGALYRCVEHPLEARLRRLHPG